MKVWLRNAREAGEPRFFLRTHSGTPEFLLPMGVDGFAPIRYNLL